MPVSIADQTAFPADRSQSTKSFGFVGILRHKSGSSDLRSEMRADPDPDAQDVAVVAAVTQDAPRKSLKRQATFENLRQSVADFGFGDKFKQVIGRKRSRDEDENPADAVLEKPDPQSRKIKARKLSDEVHKISDEIHKFSDGVRTKCQTLRKRHNSPKRTREGATTAHANDLLHPLHWNPPGVNAATLAALEGWAGGDLDGVMRYLNDEIFPPTTPVFNLVPDLSWTEDEVNDFRLFVNAADDETWLQEVVMS